MDDRFEMPAFLRNEIAAARNRTEIISILTRELARSQGALRALRELSKAIPLGTLYGGHASILRLVRGIEIGTDNLNGPAEPGPPTN